MFFQMSESTAAAPSQETKSFYFIDKSDKASLQIMHLFYQYLVILFFRLKKSSSRTEMRIMNPYLKHQIMVLGLAHYSADPMDINLLQIESLL
jgi:hypothetical protein